MKKQLLRVLSLAAGVLTMTACSSEYDFESKYNQETEREKVFNEIFVETFGEPDAYHTWGFERPEETRAVNKNGNQWHDPDYFNLENDSEVTDEEKLGVFNYVNNDVKYIKTVEQENWSEYWISQVWDGAQDKTSDGTMAPKSVPFSGEKDAIVGASYMDYLHVKESESQGDDIASWTHFNDFNSANNEGNYEGGKLYMYESGTLSFGYHNSYCNFYSDKYIVVSGATIFGADSKYAGYYYVCFDFEGSMQPEQSVMSFKVKYKHTWAKEGEGYGEETQDQTRNITLDGLYKAEDITETVIQNAFSSQFSNNVDGNGWTHTYTIESYSDVKITQYINGNKHFDGDNNFTDWIVRISPAKHKSGDPDPDPDPEYYSRRVIAEDLGTVQNTDFDYNDVVFDVVWDDAEGTGTTITLQAAGGTLPLWLVIFDESATNIPSDYNVESDPQNIISWKKEVHEWFDEGTSGITISTKTMVNTGLVEGTAKPEHFGKAIYADQVRIFAYKEVWYEITAPTGKPAQKLATGTDFKWLGERVPITGQTYYGNFLEYIHKANIWGENSYKLWYTRDPQAASEEYKNEHEGTIGL